MTRQQAKLAVVLASAAAWTALPALQAQREWLAGDLLGVSEDTRLDRNPTARVLARYREKQWTRDGDLWFYSNPNFVESSQ